MIDNTFSVKIILFLSLGSVIIASGQIQMTRDAKVVLPEGDNGGQCPSMEKRESTINEIINEIITSVSGNKTYICNRTPGWRRVAFINMTDTSYNCPTGLSLTSYSKRTCGQSLTSGGCTSTTFSVGSVPYSQVCGRIKGYQFGATSAFYYSSIDIDSYYVDGISLTHGDPGSRQHIWTFAAGLTEDSNIFPGEDCPCDTSQYNLVPAFVGNDYFCESGLNTAWNYNNIILYPDVLWDGQDCTSTSTCCQLNNPPWFTKNLPTTTTDDIELRICTYWELSIVDVPLELIELYVQ